MPCFEITAQRLPNTNQCTDFWKIFSFLFFFAHCDCTSVGETFTLTQLFIFQCLWKDAAYPLWIQTLPKNFALLSCFKINVSWTVRPKIPKTFAWHKMQPLLSFIRKCWTIVMILFLLVTKQSLIYLFRWFFFVCFSMCVYDNTIMNTMNTLPLKKWNSSTKHIYIHGQWQTVNKH